MIDTRKEHDSNYEDMEIILYFLILFNRTEYFDEYKQLLDTSEHRDFYLDSLMQHVDPLWQMSTEKNPLAKRNEAVMRGGTAFKDR